MSTKETFAKIAETEGISNDDKVVQMAMAYQADHPDVSYVQAVGVVARIEPKLFNAYANHEPEFQREVIENA